MRLYGDSEAVLSLPFFPNIALFNFVDQDPDYTGLFLISLFLSFVLGSGNLSIPSPLKLRSSGTSNILGVSLVQLILSGVMS